jgi:AraC family transcriptional regulator
MIQEKTQHYYQQKVTEVLQYINNNIGGDLSVKTLSSHFGISFFHFHRILRAALDEPLGSYIDRDRLETAVKLIRYSNDTLSEIATNIGFNDLSSFSKAFSKEFGISPNEYRNDINTILNTHIDFYFDKNAIVGNLKPKIINVSDKMVYYIQLKTKYGSDVVYKAWDELEDFAAKNKLFGWRPEFFAIYYDDPDIIPIDECISDVCFSSRKEVKLSGSVNSKLITGGKYAVFRYKGSYEHLWNLYVAIYKDWLMCTDFKLRDCPSIEKYLNYTPKTKPEKLLTEIYLPID